MHSRIFDLQLSVALVDSDKFARDRIKAIVTRLGDFLVVAEAESGPEVIQICQTKRPDIVLMDLGLPGLNGIETSTQILRHSPNMKIIILSSSDDEHAVVTAIRSGARAFVLKGGSDNDFLDALETVANGGFYLSPQISDRLLKRITNGDFASQTRPSVPLSPRELKVLRLVAEGKTTKEIAVLLDLNLQTVRSLRQTMMQKLGKPR
jgi:DNA-binding NarL/FixJ family response regulator